MRSLLIIAVNLVVLSCAGDETTSRVRQSTLGTAAPTAAPPAPTSTEGGVTTSPPITYRAVGNVIEESPTSPTLTFLQLDSLPPQVGSGIPIANWSWDAVEDEQTVLQTTWTDQSYELVEAWDGRCGVAVHALVDTPALRAALRPLGDHVTATFALQPME